MAFSAHKTEMTRMQVARFAEETLNAFLSGQEKAYAVRYVMDEVRANFGGEALSLGLIEAMLDSDDETLREAYATKAVDLLNRQVRADQADIHTR
ncbi:hypothetical protein [Sinorhizobium medicae]|uniref:hypothetical protein n=1 Tax=Sinorhizobium medicae TaxID=110321 RepID=UPI000C7D01B2|nr:hypothetical protein [Sinorhizobium medicae]PLU25735.1 hypothetical protein BMJ28_33525 [Sinorhizobium medicae]